MRHPTTIWLVVLLGAGSLLLAIEWQWLPDKKLVEHPPRTITVEWPNSGTRVGESGSVRAYVPGLPIETYDLYWETTEHPERSLHNAFYPYPHKTWDLDTSQWDWEKDGRYRLSFRAEQNGQTIATTSVTIAAPVSVIPDIDARRSTGSENAPPSLTDQLAAALPLATSSLVKTPLRVAYITNELPAWGDQEFLIEFGGKRAEDYYLFWQAEDGGYVMVPNDEKRIAHKRAIINFSSWHWKGDGPYRLSFIAQDLRAKEIARTVLYVERRGEALVLRGEEGTEVGGRTHSLPDTAPPNASEKRAVEFYVPPTQAATLLTNRNLPAPSREKVSVLARTPQAVWLGAWYADARKTAREIVAAAAKTNTVPIFVLYNIPQRDCGSYSAGGTTTYNEYLAWVEEIAIGIGEAPAMIIVEPDALAGMGCLNTLEQELRISAIRETVSRLARNQNARIYIDIGHPYWLLPEVAVARLTAAGIDEATGFSLNVSNFISTEENLRYGETLSKLLAGKHFIIDTSRNGNGAPSDLSWCNPWGRKIGTPSTTTTNHELADAFVWIKNPGESDGTCNGGPSAGTFWPEYAFTLVP